MPPFEFLRRRQPSIFLFSMLPPPLFHAGHAYLRRARYFAMPFIFFAMRHFSTYFIFSYFLFMLFILTEFFISFTFSDAGASIRAYCFATDADAALLILLPPSFFYAFAFFCVTPLISRAFAARCFR